MNNTNINNNRFTITCNDAFNTLRHIYDITNNCSGININYIAQMAETIHKRKNTWFGSVESPMDIIIIKQIIGKNGFHLKKFTSKYGVDLIWHDRVANIFMVWGNKPCLIGALYALQRQIKRFVLKHEKDMEELANMTSNMTTLQVNELNVNELNVNELNVNELNVNELNVNDASSNLSRLREEEEYDEPASKRMKTNL